jgi:hypothetical protein
MLDLGPRPDIVEYFAQDQGVAQGWLALNTDRLR